MGEKLNILALDLSSKPGYAYRVGKTISSGSIDLSRVKNEIPGLLYVRFNVWLTKLMNNHGGGAFKIVAVEKPFFRGGEATAIAIGLFTRVQEVVALMDKPAELLIIQNRSLKKYITGKGTATKEDMIRAAEKWIGQLVTDDDEADALGILRWAIEKHGS